MVGGGGGGEWSGVGGGVGDVEGLDVLLAVWGGGGGRGGFRWIMRRIRRRWRGCRRRFWGFGGGSPVVGWCRSFRR